jgi:pimeloyl-ACP methyl ester carboxylesterase
MSKLAVKDYLVIVFLCLIAFALPVLSMYPSVQLAGGQQNCYGELAIFIHGVWPQLQADNQAERVALAILANNYNIPVFSFIWNSATAISPEGWSEAKSRTYGYGIELADDILNHKLQCKDDKVRLIAHSLGGRVVLSALDNLDNSTAWNQNNFKIESVHLLGAAVDDEEISLDASDTGRSQYDDDKVYGWAIQKQVQDGSFYNLYNPEDDALEPLLFIDPDTGDQIQDYIELWGDAQLEYYPFFEEDSALGYHGAQPGIDIPSNYVDKNIQNEILPNIDADGDGICDLRNPYFFNFCTIHRVTPGDNHFGYMGIRDASNNSRLIPNEGDGAIDVIVNDWLNMG